MTKEDQNQHARKFVLAVAGTCASSVFLLVLRLLVSDSSRYIFLCWNLALAVLPAMFSWWLVLRLKDKPWFAAPQIILTILWLVFLPNSFYLITDLVHLTYTNEVSLFYDMVMLASFAFNGLILGYISVFLVHREVRKRYDGPKSFSFVTVIFLLISFAIYLGRYTRWNTWDILLQPAGLLFDVSDRFVNPAQHGETYVATAVLFVVLTSIYMVIWEGAYLIRRR